jgi:retron-type reverse transcriptase
MIVYRELSSIEADLGISARTLYRLSNNIGKHYREKQIPKSDGTMRSLSVPDEILKKVQRAIAERLLVYEPVSVYAKAYRIGGTPIANASPHVGKGQILKLDILHFFDSISYSSVKEKCFPEKKYAEQIRILLAMLCYHGDSLPQGAPTSPAISNIVMRDFDIEVGNWCAERKIAYSRYCDDMTFSGDFDEKEIIALVKKELKGLGLFLKDSKTKVVTSEKRQTATGIVVNEKINLTKEYKKKIRQEMYYIKKFGLENHAKNQGITDSFGYLSSLRGRIAFVLQTCPWDSEFIRYKKFLQKIKPI